MNQLMEITNCKKCNQSLTIDEGDLVCTKCGEVHSQNTPDMTIDYDQGPEKTGSRVGPAFDPTKRMPGTTIGKPGNKTKLTKIDNQGKFDHIEIKAVNKIHTLSDELGLNQSIEDLAEELFKKMRTLDLLKGRSTEEFAAGCVYTACKRHNVVRSIKDFSRKSGINRNRLTKIHHLISEHYDQEQSIATPEQYMPKLENELPLKLKIKQKTRKILNNYPIKSGKDPRVLLGAAVYLASLQVEPKITQRDIALALDCSPVGIRARVIDMKKYLPESF